MAAQSKAERHVLSVSTDGSGKGSSLFDRIKGGSYSDEQFRSLSEHNQKRVQKFHGDTKKKKGKRKGRKEKRKLAKAKSARDEDSGEEHEEATEATTKAKSSSAGSHQFGSNGASANKKAKS